MERSPPDNQPPPRPPTGRVPVYLSSFVGRTQELAQLDAALSRDDLRLLTLVGPGGSGKTRLAAQATLASAGRFEDGPCWVSLEGLNSPAQIPQAIIAALDLVESSGQPLELLAGVLNLRQTLLVLDNCEHLLAACARITGTLLRGAPELRILATSRERLNIAGEHVWQVPGLSFPSTARPLYRGRMPAQANPMAYDSVRLFLERARAALPSFELTDAAAPHVIRICRQVDGLPLAVELAAARVRVLGVEQIAERLARHLDTLGGGPRSAPGRHLTLRATFEWSHDQLSPPEQALFRRLGVFQGRFTLGAAEAVAAGSAGGGRHSATLPPEAVLDLLTGLVEKSLLAVERPPGDRTVFRLLDMVRRYAEEKLAAAGELEDCRERHLAYYAGLAATAEPGLKGPEQRAWVQRLSLANDNLRAALGWAIDRHSSGKGDRYRLMAQQMANALFWFWNAADMFGEGRDWLERVLALSEPRPPEAQVAEGLRMAGTMAWLLGDMATAWRRHQESRDLFELLEDERGSAHATMMLGRVRLYQGQAGEAVAYLSESADRLQRAGAVFECGLALGALSAALAMAGDPEKAYDTAAECRDIFQAIGDPFFLGMALGDLGWAAYHNKDLTAATQYLQEALALRRLIASNWQIAQALIYLAEISRYQGNDGAAVAYLEEARALAEDVGATSWLVLSNRHLGQLAIAGHRWSEAAAYLRDSLAASNRLNHRANAAMSLEGLAVAAAAGQDRSLAGTLLGAAERLRDEVGPPQTPAERADLAGVIERLRPWFADPQFASSRDDGRALSPGEAGRRAESLTWRFDNPDTAISPAHQQLQIFALGPVDVILDGRRLVAADWSYAKPKELFFYLVANPPRTKEEIGLDFWPDASADQLRRNFRATLYHLRQALGRRDWVLFDNGRYAFNRALDYWYDVEAFEGHIAAARTAAGPDRAITELDAAAALYRGEFLAGLALDEWAGTRREALDRIYLDALLNRAELFLEAGKHAEAADRFREILARDSLLERAHRGLMRSYEAMGQRGQALRHYQSLVALLAGELGTAPDAATTALYDRLKIA